MWRESVCVCVSLYMSLPLLAFPSNLLAVDCKTGGIPFETFWVWYAQLSDDLCAHLDRRSHSPEGIKVPGFWAVSRRLWEQRTRWTGVELGGAGGVTRAAGPRGGRGGTRSGGGLQGAPVRWFVRCYGIVSPVRTRAGGARRVGAGGFALTSLSLATCFSLMVAVGWGHGMIKNKTKKKTV